jgi:hypothetical protein
MGFELIRADKYCIVLSWADWLLTNEKNLTAHFNTEEEREQQEQAQVSSFRNAVASKRGPLTEGVGLGVKEGRPSSFLFRSTELVM